jgi:predicted outer membrane repeat protein
LLARAARSSLSFSGRGRCPSGRGFCEGGPLKIYDSVFTGNVASDGGALNVQSTPDAVVTRCTFRSNSASVSGGDVSGGAIYSNGVIVTDSTFEGNSATNGGGAIYSPNPEARVGL